MTLQASTIGIGTYLGGEDDATDALYLEAIIEAVRHTCSVIDTALNYRGMKSERIVGRAVQGLMEKDPGIRERLTIATKGGFIPVDVESGKRPQDFFRDRFLKTGVLSETDVVMGCHSLRPEYVRECVLMSLKNLGLEYVDVYYVHNPEIQLSVVLPGEFYRRLSGAFEVLEGFVREGRIRMYGTATWDGYRLDADELGGLSLKRVLQAAEDTSAGKRHNFKVIQLPVNVHMPEAAVVRNQEVDGKRLTILEAAVKAGLYVMTSATLLQRQALSGDTLFSFQELDNLGSSAARRAIQVVRSLDGVTTSLVGMKTAAHVRENLQLLNIPKLDPKDARRIISEFA
ncbi:MAG: aldo/keto reductase [Candidatus Thorarchaeota archaeon]|jgi:aryl-alcohol dehydrogenase-like predicted oxidoreductase